MKKTGLFAFLALLIAALCLLSSCGEKLTQKKVESDPMAYVREGIRLTAKDLPLADLTEKTGEKLSGVLSYKEGSEEFSATFGADPAAKKGALSFELKSPQTEEEAENAFPIPTKGDLYLDGTKIAARLDLLRDIVGSDTVGLDLAALKEIKKTTLYRSFLEVSGMTEEQFDQKVKESFGDLPDVGKLEELQREFTEKIKPILEDALEATGVAEEEITLDGKPVRTVAVSHSLKESAYKALGEEVWKYLEKVSGLFGEKVQESFSDALPENPFDAIKVEQSGKSYLSVRTGELLRQETDLRVTPADPETDSVGVSALHLKSDVSFGADPAAAFLPVFEVRFETEGKEEVKLVLKGAAVSGDGAWTLDGTISAEKGEEKKEFGYRFVYEDSGDYKLTVQLDRISADVLKGTFKRTADGLSCTAVIFDPDREGQEGGEFSLDLRFNAEIPAMPAYKDLLELTPEELSALIPAEPEPEEEEEYEFSDYALSVVGLYADMEEEDLKKALEDGYAKAGLPDALSYLYYNLAQYRAADLIQNYGAKQEDMQAIWDEIVKSDGTYLDLAAAFEDAYARATAPSEEEIKDLLQNFRDYGFESREDALAFLRDNYGDYVTVPEA